MGASTNVAPVIIKKKKIIVSGGHHGGAWKVAYADFVTAMMAFFLLMWLLSATTEQQRKGISDHFSPTIPISRTSGGGDGVFGGTSLHTQEPMVQQGTGETDMKSAIQRQSQDADAAALQEFTSLEAELMGHSGESLVSLDTLKHIVTRVTDEGLIIELFAHDGMPLFEEGSDKPTLLLRDLARMIARVTDKVSNKVALGGHIRAQPVVLANNPVWELSGARATRMRRLLEGSGMESERIQRVTGHADRQPVVENPMDIRNNRIEVILLRN